MVDTRIQSRIFVADPDNLPPNAIADVSVGSVASIQPQVSHFRSTTNSRHLSERWFSSVRARALNRCAIAR
jgi:hypothetical protein